MTHPITPPPELVQQWIGDYYGCPVSGEPLDVETAIATRAAQWGADQDLEACCECLTNEWGNGHGDRLQRLRRPKPPSLKLQALNDLNTAYNEDAIDDTTYCNIRRALEALPND